MKLRVEIWSFWLKGHGLYCYFILYTIQLRSLIQDKCSWNLDGVSIQKNCVSQVSHSSFWEKQRKNIYQFPQMYRQQDPVFETEHQKTYYIVLHSACIIRCLFISERERHLNYLTDNPLAQTTTFTWYEKCVQWFRVTQLRAVPFKAIKCGFFFSEVILFNPSGLKQPIKQSL